MKKPRKQHSIGRGARNTLRLLFPALALMFVQGCTDLDIPPTSSITPENFYQNEEEVLGGLAAVYHELNVDGMLWSYWNMSQVTSDEMIVPTRGSDWFDNGRWLEIHKHTWGANSTSGLDDVNRIWTDSFRGVLRANVLLASLENVTVANQAAIAAEARGLRAYYYYMLLDMFGGVPIVDSTTIEARPRNTAREVFDFIDAELQAARADLPASWPASDYGRMTQGAADAILASLYLNAGVFTTDTPNATAYNSCAGVTVGGGTACDAAIAVADRIINSGVYTLSSDFHDNFAPDNFNSPENIFVVNFLPEAGLGLNMIQRALHYRQFNPDPWNGFAALAETYNAFDADDTRRTVFLEGPQVNIESGLPVTERDDVTPLVFTVDILDETAAGEGEGTRVMKWPPDPNHVAQDNGNDYTIFRLAEIYLIKAEAELEGGTGNPLALVNMIRARSFEPDEPLGAVDRDVILAERLFELTAEGKRRQDLIRHGKFTDAWSFKAASAPHYVRMPIPQPQLDANPELTQNPGY